MNLKVLIILSALMLITGCGEKKERTAEEKCKSSEKSIQFTTQNAYKHLASNDVVKGCMLEDIRNEKVEEAANICGWSQKEVEERMLYFPKCDNLRTRIKNLR